MSKTVEETERALRAAMVLPLKPDEDPELHIGRDVLAFCVKGTPAERKAKTRAMLIELREELAETMRRRDGGEK